MNGPNPLKVVWSILWVVRKTREPNPIGEETLDHSDLEVPLDALAQDGLRGLSEQLSRLDSYIRRAEAIRPDSLDRREAMAFWVNLYNAGAMRLATETLEMGVDSVLRVPGAFGRPLVEVDGENLSLDAIEHGKIRRFGDPRIHAALVCGSLSCPTLRSKPYRGRTLDSDLDDQMRTFLTGGGATIDHEGTLLLSRVFKWFGRDFVSPDRMPTFVPSSRQAVHRAIGPWLSPEMRDRRTVEYQTYDWGLACDIG